jgi:hypothetical protein
MNAPDTLDLSSLAQFRASALLNSTDAAIADGVPVQVALPLIDFDPMQPRRSVDEGTIAQLAQSIQTHGVLEPVSLRRHPEAAGRYIVNRGNAASVLPGARAWKPCRPSWTIGWILSPRPRKTSTARTCPGSIWRSSLRSARGKGIRARRSPEGSTSLDHSSPRPQA